ncbi:MAG: hypothetical protein Kapaf2KO_10270 [Candidatus Kapaibacteriales bacterium]
MNDEGYDKFIHSMEDSFYYEVISIDTTDGFYNKQLNFDKFFFFHFEIGRAPEDIIVSVDTTYSKAVFKKPYSLRF